MINFLPIWDWIREVKSLCVNPSYDYLLANLQEMPIENSSALACSYRDLMHISDVPVVWQAGSLLSGNPLGDDSFEYFRSWVIWNGFSFYQNMLRETDNIIDCDVDLVNNSFEPLSACMEFLPHPTIRSPLTPKSFAPAGWDWKIALDEIELSLPRLWSVYGAAFNKSPVGIEGEGFLDVPGIGVVRVGDRVRHKMGNGDGVIVEIVSSKTKLVKIKFFDEIKAFGLAAEYFSKVE